MTPRKLKFVLAEDNPGDVFLIRRAFDLEGFSYELLVAKDGEEAMRYVQEAAAGTRVIDLILLDLNLPAMTEAKSWRHSGASHFLRQFPPSY
ncbi:MAG: hypothetical protein IPP47_31580 [Bryobacterales bacterium]|nr:hypothetical protein [Bryobacterales bacterium]